MSSINNTNYNIDQTVRVFDSFYEYDVNVPAAEYDIVYSYFRREMTTANAAGNFTVYWEWECPFKATVTLLG